MPKRQNRVGGMEDLVEKVRTVPSLFDLEGRVAVVTGGGQGTGGGHGPGW
jgi:hypothetical protein